VLRLGKPEVLSWSINHLIWSEGIDRGKEGVVVPFFHVWSLESDGGKRFFLLLRPLG
jgi:hypothetical protein